MMSPLVPPNDHLRTALARKVMINELFIDSPNDSETSTWVHARFPADRPYYASLCGVKNLLRKFNVSHHSRSKLDNQISRFKKQLYDIYGSYTHILVSDIAYPTSSPAVRKTACSIDSHLRVLRRCRHRILNSNKNTKTFW